MSPQGLLGSLIAKVESSRWCSCKNSGYRIGLRIRIFVASQPILIAFARHYFKISSEIEKQVVFIVNCCLFRSLLHSVLFLIGYLYYIEII